VGKSYLQDLEMYVMRTEKSKAILKQLCLDLNSGSKTMIEIGSYAGESTEIFAKFFEKVYAIDPWISGMEISDGIKYPNVKLFMDSDAEKRFDLILENNKNIIKIKDFDYNKISEFKNNSVDFIYIDAIHSEEEVERQIIAWLPKIKKSGAIGGHDYTNPDYPGVAKAVNKIVGIPEKIYDDDGSWYRYKKTIA
jgi:hypothetical protein